MRRILVLFLCAAGLGMLVSGCGGSSSSNSNKVTKIIVAPSILSLTKGQTQQITVQGQNAGGNTVALTTNVTFNLVPPSGSSQSPSIVASISLNGLLCGGIWDSTSNPVVCAAIADNPATGTVDEGVGTMTLTATADEITSDPITVYVHEAVTGVSAGLVSTSNPPGPGGCISQGTEARFTASVIGPGGSDITSTVGPINFVSSAPSVAAVDTSVTPAPPPTDQFFKANVPGKTLIFASVSGTNGTATPLYTCSPAKIVVTPASASIATKGTQTLDADVTDVNGVKLTSVPLIWSTSHAQVATVATATTTTGKTASAKVTAGDSPGTAYISAACALPSCNLNEQKPLFSNLVKITVTGTATTPKIYAASTATPTSGVTNLIPLNATDNTAGTAIPFATDQVPNSMSFGTSSTKLWIGTNTGLATFDPASGTNGAFGTTLTSVKGRILAVAPGGGAAVVSDTSTGVVHVTTGSSDTLLNIAGATAAAYTPDGGTLYIVAGTSLYSFTPSFSSAPTHTVLGPTGRDISVLANGQLFFLAENGQFDVRSTCDRETYDTFAANPTNVFSLPDGSQMIGADDANVWGIGVTWTPPENVVCKHAFEPAGGTPSFTSLTDNFQSHTNPGGTFHARQIIVTPDSKRVYITNDTSKLVAYDPATGNVTNINIGAATFTGASTIDSSKVYVGADDGKVHVITTSNNSDSAQIAVSGLCTGSCKPDLVAVQPK